MEIFYHSLEDTARALKLAFPAVWENKTEEEIVQILKNAAIAIIPRMLNTASGGYELNIHYSEDHIDVFASICSMHLLPGEPEEW